MLKNASPVFCFLALSAFMTCSFADSGEAGELLEFDKIPTKMDRLKELESQFDQSLHEFDAMLIEDRELLDPQDIDNLQDPMKEQNSASSFASQQTKSDPGSSGMDDGAGGSEQQAAGTGAMATQGQGGESGAVRDAGQHVGETSQGGSPGSGSGQQDASRPAAVRNAQGDDIVARQLREAAEQESDPQLKARLWEEYYRYKKGAQ